MKAKVKLRRKNKIIGLKEFRENSEKVISQIKKGQTFTVLKKSQPVFDLVAPSIDELEDEEGWETILDFTEGGKKSGMPIEDFIKLIDKVHG